MEIHEMTFILLQPRFDFSEKYIIMPNSQIDGLVQDCGNSSALAIVR